MPAIREAFLFRLECADPAYFWSGVGDITVPADSIVPETTYLGGGELMGGIPELEQLINGTAAGVEFTASGADEESVRLAAEDRNQVDGSTVRIGSLPLDEDWQIAGPVQWEWEGVAKIVTIARQSGGDGGVTRTISLTVESSDTARSRNQLSLFTDADQRKRSADDAFFSHVGRITAGSSRRFEGA